MTKELRWGFTTGACATAAAKAAATTLCTGESCSSVTVRLPDGDDVSFVIAEAHKRDGCCEAAVRKDAGDDPDVTDGMLVWARVSFSENEDITFSAGRGVGVITLPGMQLPVGEPAINPGPRAMITNALREISNRGFNVEISIPKGEEAAKRTFNGKLGIQGGLSILGTTGRVRPYSNAALRDALVCSLDVAEGCGISAPVLVPGNYGRRVALGRFKRAEREVVEVGNEWGFMLDAFTRKNFSSLLVLGHPGKLVKLAMGYWDTHSRRSPGVVPSLIERAEAMKIPAPENVPTAEGFFQSLSIERRQRLGNELSRLIYEAVEEKIGSHLHIAVVLAMMSGDILGMFGDISPWTGEENE